MRDLLVAKARKEGEDEGTYKGFYKGIIIGVLIHKALQEADLNDIMQVMEPGDFEAIARGSVAKGQELAGLFSGMRGSSVARAGK